MLADSTPESSSGWGDRAGSGRWPGAPLYPILDAEVHGDPDPGPLFRALADLSIRVAQLRAKNMSAREFLHWVRAGVRGTAGAGVTLLVNDRVDIALLSGAGGAHIGQDDLSAGRARQFLGDRRVLGLSTHSLAELEEARSAPCDYLAIGPVFPTGSKVNPEPVVGLEGVRAATRETGGRSLVAIGGIRGRRAAEVIASGADAFAVVSAIDMTSPARARESARVLLRAAREESGKG